MPVRGPTVRAQRRREIIRRLENRAAEHVRAAKPEQALLLVAAAENFRAPADRVEGGCKVRGDSAEIIRHMRDER